MAVSTVNTMYAIPYFRINFQKIGYCAANSTMLVLPAFLNTFS